MFSASRTVRYISNSAAVRATKPARKAEPTATRRPTALNSSRHPESLVLYKDDDIIALNKPSGLPVHAGPKVTDDLCLHLHNWQYDSARPPNLAHRLDRDTSGVILLSRHSDAARRVARLFQERRVKKTYWALTVNVPTEMQGSVNVPLGTKDIATQNSPRHHMHRAVLRTDKVDLYSKELAGQTLQFGIQLALTDYRVLSCYGNRCSLVEVRTSTGFKHQVCPPERRRCSLTYRRSKMTDQLGFHNLPFLAHRKSVKRGFEFTLMVVGESGLGKSTLIQSLFLTNFFGNKTSTPANERIEQTVTIDATTVDIEEKGVKLRLTVVDTPGFGDAVNNDQCWQPVIDYCNEKYDQYLRDESGLNRRNIEDHRVHCCLYFINPLGHGLKPLDIEFMKQLHNLVNIIPVIAKADTLTPKEIKALKMKIMNEIQGNGIKIYTGETDDDDEDNPDIKELKEIIPFAVVGSNTLLEVNGKRVRGRLYPWGVVEVENKDHCDFVKLRTMLIRTHMQDLKDYTQDVHYENFRKKKLLQASPGRKVSEYTDYNINAGGQVVPDEATKTVALQEKEKELEDMRRQMALLQAQLRGAQQSDAV